MPTLNPRFYSLFSRSCTLVSESLNQSEAKLKNNRDLDMRVFPRFQQFVCFHFEFSLAYGNVNLCSGITLVLVFQYTIRNCSTLIQNSAFPYRRIDIQNTHFP